LITLTQYYFYSLVRARGPNAVTLNRVPYSILSHSRLHHHLRFPTEYQMYTIAFHWSSCCGGPSTRYDDLLTVVHSLPKSVLPSYNID